MPRRKLIRQSNFPYHVLNRSNNKDWFAVPMEVVWQIAMQSLGYSSSKHPVKIHAFVLMSNHYHMLITTPDSNIDRFMQAFGKTFSERLKVVSGRINRMFGGPYKWSIISEFEYLYNVNRYVFQNPLRANLCSKCEDYQYSTLFYEIRKKKCPVEVKNLLDIENKDTIEWLNKMFSSEQENGLRKALKHSQCIVKKDRKSRKPIIYDNLF